MRSNSFGERLGGRVSEQKVARLWLENAVRLGWLDCLDGGRLRLLYPGRPGVGPGPDFRDAILLTPAGAVISGDVELHLEPKGWVRHGHHLDRNYNGVVLHVVLWPQGGSGSPKEALLQAGVRVPTTALFPVLQHLRGRAKATGEREPGVPISPPEAFLVSGLDQRDSGQLLDQAGDSRFLAKGAHWSRELSRAGLGEGAEELLYQALMEALGYSRNRSPFLAVAQGLPIAFLRRAFQGWSPAERALSLKALFLGSGGFADRFTSSLAHLRERWASLGMLPLVELGSWDL
ncbi:MAG: DUF2851 family protein, partial [Chloroflexi bacterium]|nr:DUF2851 family protein [Chloroflexota bacterium]